MQRVQNISKNYKYQSALPTLYTPHSILPYSYCQDGGGVPVVYGLVKLAGSVLFSGQAIFTSLAGVWASDTAYLPGNLVIGTDDYYYRCFAGHTASADNRPVTGLVDPYYNYWYRIGTLSGSYMALWLGLCCGNVDLISIYKNTDVPLVDGIDYTSNQYNDGEGAYYPEGIANTAKLPGIAHILFGGEYSLLANPDEKIPDTRLILKRRLPETISHTEIYASAEYSHYGNTWVPGFTYNLSFLWTIRGKYPFFVIYNREVRRLFASPHTSEWADWVQDEPGGTQTTWLHIGYEWSMRGQKFYPWYANQVYGVGAIDGYNLGNAVIGKDNNVYVAQLAHVPEYINEPSVGAQWQDYWKLLAIPTAVAPGSPYPPGIAVIGSDGLVYRCTLTNTWPTNIPITGENWQDYWQLATIPNRIFGKDYYVAPPEYFPGMIKLGSNGANYLCKLYTDLTPDNMPVDGADWEDYWESTPSVFPVTTDLIICGTDSEAYTLIQDSTLVAINAPVSGEDWPIFWEKVLAPDIFLGNNPAAIAYDILTNTFYGLAIPADKIDIGSFNTAATFYDTKNYGLNIKVTDIAEAKKVLNQMLDWCDLVLTVGTDGLIQCKVFDPDAESIGTLSDDDYSSFVLTKQSWKDLYNEFEATYSDPARLYEATSIVLKNEAAIEMAGGIVKKKTFDLTAFTNRTICANRLNEIMRRESYPRNTVSCEVSGAWYFARPCDLIKIVKSEYGINNYFRVISVSTGKIDELNISLELVDATEVMFKEWDEPVVSENRRRLISPFGAPFTQGKI